MGYRCSLGLLLLVVWVCPQGQASDTEPSKVQLLDQATHSLMHGLSRYGQDHLHLIFDGALRHHSSSAAVQADGLVQVPLHMAYDERQGHRRGRLWSDVPQLQQALQIHALDVQQLQWLQGRLSGSISWHMGRRGRYELGRVKTDGPQVLAWSLGGHQRARLQPVSIQVDAAVVEGARVVDLLLAEFIKPGGQALQARLRHESGRWWVDAVTLHWNKAVHQLDPTDLTLERGRLVGTVKVVLNPDPWLGGNGPQSLQVQLDMPLCHDVGFSQAVYRLTGSSVQRRAQSFARIGHALRGRYQLKGVDGACAGQLRGVRFPAGPIKNVSPEGNKDFVSACRHFVQQARAYANWSSLWLTGYETFNPFPVVASKQVLWQAGMATYAQATAAALLAGHVVQTGTASAARADETFGPFMRCPDHGDESLPESGGKSAWFQLTDWSVLGPLAAGTPVLKEPLMLPEVIPDLDIEGTAGAAIRWRSDGDAAAHHIAKRSAHLVTYAYRQLRSQKDQTVWLAIQSEAACQLWCNGVPLWQSGKPGTLACLQIPLRPGINTLLLRQGSTARAQRLAPVWLGVSVKPRDALEIARLRDVAPAGPGSGAGAHILAYHGDGSRLVSEADPPLYWDLDTGTNVRWRLPAESGGDPFVHAGKVYVLSEPNHLSVVDLQTGNLHWQRTVPGQLPAQDDERRGAKPFAGTSPLVTSDAIYVWMGYGTLARYDHTGRLVWSWQSGQVWPWWDGYRPGHDRSLVAIDKLLIVAQQYEDKHHTLVAIDADTGVERWRSQAFTKVTTTVVPMRLVSARGAGTVLVTGHGHVLCHRTGQLQLRLDVSGLGHTQMDVPLVVGDRLFYYGRLGQACWRLWVTEAGQLAGRRLWHSRRQGAFGEPNAGIVHQGRLHIPRLTDDFTMKRPICWSQLDTYDTLGGSHLARFKPTMRDAINPLPMHVAGRYLVLADAGSSKSWTKVKRGQVAFFLAGDTPVPVATVSLKQGRQLVSLAVHGKELLVRTRKEVVCLAVDDAAGRLAQEQALAQQALARIRRYAEKGPVETRSPLRPLAVKVKGNAHEASVPLTPRVPIGAWSLAGPLADTNELPERIAAATKGTASMLSAGDQALTWQPLPSSALRRSLVSVIGMTGTHYHTGHEVALAKALQGHAGKGVSLLRSSLRVEQSVTMALSASKGTGRLWIGGVEVDNDDVIDFAAGTYVVMVAIRHRAMPKFARPRLSVAFVPLLAGQSRKRQRRVWINRLRPVLSRIIDQLPGSAEATYAQHYLSELSVEAKVD